MSHTSKEPRPAGYAYLFNRLNIAPISHWHVSRVSSSGIHQKDFLNGVRIDVYPSRYWPGDTIGDHLEFALKYDGVNLGILYQIFEKLSEMDLRRFIQSKPTGKYTRRIWFFYEFLTGKRLAIEDLHRGNYVDALEKRTYYTVQNGERSGRHRIVNNLLGVQAFCPIVRKTDVLEAQDSSVIRRRCEQIMRAYSPELFRRALRYLYTKETKSSFAIEHIQPDVSKTETFIASLEQAEKEDFCEKDHLIALQNHIVDQRFKESDYREKQNYVGQTVRYEQEIIHYISPKPEDIHRLMDGLLATHKRMKLGMVSSIVHAAIISYGFVFLHPFEDGNGRIHRLLIHNILSMGNLFPHGLMFPISASMLQDSIQYDASLEAFSRPLLQHIKYTLDALGHMTVENETAHWYQYIEMTSQAEALYKFVQTTLEETLPKELSFLDSYTKTKQSIKNILDMPDHLIDLFIHLCLQNKGTLSQKKRAAYFTFLSEEEISNMEKAIREEFDYK